ncbi:hypothetical protein ACH4VX_29915 [Streptomyces sp. NPDC020731]
MASRAGGTSSPRSRARDHCLVHLVAYGAFAAVDRIETALASHTAQEIS